MRDDPKGRPPNTSGGEVPPDDVHAALSKLIRTDFGEVIWRDRQRFGPVAAGVSPASGRTYLYEAVVGGKVSAARWLVRLGGRVREPQGGLTSQACPWQAALSTSNPFPMLRVLLASDSLTPAELGRCADDLLMLRQRASSAHDVNAAQEVYSEACQRIGRDPIPQGPRAWPHRGSPPER